MASQCCAVLLNHFSDHPLVLHLVSKASNCGLQELEQIYNACVDNAQTSVKDVRAFTFFEFKEFLAR
jgi:hypothetical protein